MTDNAHANQESIVTIGLSVQDAQVLAWLLSEQKSTAEHPEDSDTYARLEARIQHRLQEQAGEL